MSIVLIKRKKALTLVALLIATLLSAIILFSTRASAVFYGYALKKLPIYSVETNEKKVAISFDCAWGVDYTEKLLAIMKTHNVRCTFFTVEFWTNKYPEYVKLISDNGHEIGTHSATHPHMAKLDKVGVKKELTTSVSAIESITSKKVELFRAPFGEYNDTVIDTATELGLYTIQWDVDSLDWKDLSATEITKRVVSRVKSGSIVLFHNQGLHTAEALPDIIYALQQNGFTFVPIGELIYKNNYKILPNGSQQYVS